MLGPPFFRFKAMRKESVDILSYGRCTANIAQTASSLINSRTVRKGSTNELLRSNIQPHEETGDVDPLFSRFPGEANRRIEAARAAAGEAARAAQTEQKESSNEATTE